MDFLGVKTELAKPVYTGLTDEACAEYMRTNNAAPINRASMSGDELFSHTDTTQFGSLADAKKTQWLSLCALSSVDPFGPAVAVVQDIFTGVTGNTIANLNAARTETKTIGQSFGFARINEGDVRKARNY